MVQDAVSDEIFSEKSETFIISCMYLGYMIVAWFVIGILRDCFCCIRKHMRVGTAGNSSM